MSINNTQANQFVNERVRPIAEQIRALKIQLDDALAVYLGDTVDFFAPGGNSSNSTYTDLRTDVPLSMTAGRVTNNHAVWQQIIDAINNGGQYIEVERSCVRSP